MDPQKVLSGPRILHRVRKITPQLPITCRRNCAIWMPGKWGPKARTSWATRDTGSTN